MSQPTTSNPRPQQVTDENLNNLLCSLEYSLSAASKSPWTVIQYKRSVLKFANWLYAKHGAFIAFPDEVRRTDVIAWLMSMQGGGLQQNSIRHYYAGVRAFFNWFEFEPEGEALAGKGWRNPTYKVKDQMWQLKAALTSVKVD